MLVVVLSKFNRCLIASTKEERGRCGEIFPSPFPRSSPLKIVQHAGRANKEGLAFPNETLRLPQTFKRQSAMSKVFISVIVGIFKVFYFKMYRLRIV